MCVQLGLLFRRPAGLLPRKLKMMGLHIYGPLNIYIYIYIYEMLYIQNMEEVYTSRALIVFSKHHANSAQLQVLSHLSTGDTSA